MQQLNILCFVVGKLARELVENINRKIFLTNSLKKQSSRQNQFRELRETVLNVSTTRTNNQR